MRTALLCAVTLSAAHAHAAFPEARLARLLGFSGRPRPQALPVESTSSCVVVGTLKSRQAALSVAAVRCSDRTRDVWVGDALDGGTVTHIGHAEILVTRGDRIERIGTGRVVPRPMAPGPATDVARTPRAKVDAALRDPSSLLQEVRVLPAFVEGRWSGLRAAWVKEGSWLATLGLQRGDLIRSVNGRALDGPEAALAALQQLPHTRDFEFELERNGERMIRRVQLE